VSAFVVGIEIPPPEKVITYDRQVQCSIIDSNMIKQLQTIREEEEHDQEAN